MPITIIVPLTDQAYSLRFSWRNTACFGNFYWINSPWIEERLFNLMLHRLLWIWAVKYGLMFWERSEGHGRDSWIQNVGLLLTQNCGLVLWSFYDVSSHFLIWLDLSTFSLIVRRTRPSPFHFFFKLSMGESQKNWRKSNNFSLLKGWKGQASHRTILPTRSSLVVSSFGIPLRRRSRQHLWRSPPAQSTCADSGYGAQHSGWKGDREQKMKSVQACRRAVSPAESGPVHCHRCKCNYSKARYKQPLITA